MDHDPLNATATVVPARRTPQDDEPARMSEVGSATEMLDAGLERLSQQASMLTDRLGNYLRPVPEGLLDTVGIKEDPVPAAANILRAATVVNRVADELAELRDRFEG